MAVSSIAWMLLGSTRSIGPSARVGGTTPTDTTPASGAVEAATSSAFWRRRGTTPMTSSMTPSARPMRRLHVVRDLGIVHSWVDIVAVPRRAPAEDAVDQRNEEERGEGRHQEAADDRAAQRRVLLAPLAEAERHRQHAEAHGERGHQHRAQAGGAGREGGRARIVALQHLVVRERDDEDAVRGGDADANDGAHEGGHAERRLGDV